MKSFKLFANKTTNSYFSGEANTALVVWKKTENYPYVINNTYETIYLQDEIEKDEKKEFFDLSTMLKKITSYKDFLKVIGRENSLYLPGMYLVFFRDNGFYIFKSDCYSKMLRQICVYYPENDYMKDFSIKLFRLNETNGYTSFIESSVINHCVFIVDSRVLELLYTKAWLESSNTQLFRKFKITSKNGKVRDIIAPNDDIKISLQKLNDLFQVIYAKRNIKFQVAYKKGKNVKSGAKLHVKDKYIYNLDLHDFYPSCKKEITRKYTDFLFSYTFNREFTEREFFDVIFIDGGLFIGSPVSGILANTVISQAVSYMNNICKKHKMHLSVYADDICFSSNKFISKDFAISIFNSAFSKYNLDMYFKLNEKKSIGLSACNRKITGVSINENDEITVPGRYYLDLRSQICHLAKGDSSTNINKLRGKIAYALMVDETGKISRYLKKFIETVKEYKLCNEEKIAELESV